MNNNRLTLQQAQRPREACAACKHHRRKCAPDCFLAPYFPSNRLQDFQNARKLFGVRNIIKMIKSAEPNLKEDAVTAIIYEANAWANDPAGGCHRRVLILQDQVRYMEEELHRVRQALDFYKQQAPAKNNPYDFGQGSKGDVFDLGGGVGGGPGAKLGVQDYHFVQTSSFLGESTTPFDGQLPVVGGSDQEVFVGGSTSGGGGEAVGGGPGVQLGVQDYYYVQPSTTSLDGQWPFLGGSDHEAFVGGSTSGGGGEAVGGAPGVQLGVQDYYYVQPSTTSLDGQWPFVGGSDQDAFVGGSNSSFDRGIVNSEGIVQSSDKVVVEDVERMQDPQHKENNLIDFFSPSSLGKE